MELELNQLDRRYQDLRIRSRDREERIAASILRHGQQSPVLVVREGEAWVLIDGFTRWHALERLGQDLIVATALELVTSEALLLRHRLGSATRRCPLEEGWLAECLLQESELTQDGLAMRMQRSSSWLSRRLALVKVLPKSVQQAVRDGRLPSHAAATYLVPMTRVNRDHAERLVAHLAPRTATVREVERLYRGWKAATDDARERIVDHPWLFLAAEQELEREPSGPVDAAERTRRDLEAAVGLVRRVRRVVQDGLVVLAEQRAGIHWAWRDLVQAVEALRRPLEELTDAGPANADRHPSPTPRRARGQDDRAGTGDQPERSTAGTRTG